MTLRGWVDAQLSPRIKIPTPSGIEIEIVIDTGFNGEIVLPKNLLRKLEFTHRGWTVVELADGSKVTSELHEGMIFWFDKKKKVRVHATESDDALLGTRMLLGYRLELDIEAGQVIIKGRR